MVSAAPPPSNRPKAIPLLRTCDEVDPERDVAALAAGQAVDDQRLRRLVDRHDGQHHERGAPPRGRHQPRIRPSTTEPTRLSTINATIGLMSSGPIIGMKRRKMRR